MVVSSEVVVDMETTINRFPRVVAMLKKSSNVFGRWATGKERRNNFSIGIEDITVRVNTSLLFEMR